MSKLQDIVAKASNTFSEEDRRHLGSKLSEFIQQLFVGVLGAPAQCSCGAAINDTMEYCAECGASLKLKKTCKCGADVIGKFCTKCGVEWKHDETQNAGSPPS